MKLLVISPYYPPYHYGGYEIRIKNIMDELYLRGIKVLVLTSIRDGFNENQSQGTYYEIVRKLHLRQRTKGFLDEIRCDILDLVLLDRKIQKFKPDLIYLGNITNLSKSIIPFLATSKLPIIYDEGGTGLIGAWSDKGVWYDFVDGHINKYPILNTLKPLIVYIICKISKNRIKQHWAWPDNMQGIFNSIYSYESTLQNGVTLKDGKVIYSGLDTELFYYQPKNSKGTQVSIIIPGRIEPHKGQIDGIRLLAMLENNNISGELIIVGSIWSKTYYNDLKKELKILHAQDRVQLLPMVSQDQLVDLYHQADICLFPSYQIEGFSRTPLEAMACGCIVMSYGNEGSSEIIRDQQNGFIVTPEDYPRMVKIIKEIIAKPKLMEEIRDEARRSIDKLYTMKRYISQIENIILNSN